MGYDDFQQGSDNMSGRQLMEGLHQIWLLEESFKWPTKANYTQNVNEIF